MAENITQPEAENKLSKQLLRLKIHATISWLEAEVKNEIAYEKRVM